VLLKDHNDIPQWIAEITRICVSPGDYPKEITVELGRIASLFQAWPAVAQITQGHRLTHPRTELLNVEALFNAGDITALNAIEPFGSLTAKDAAERLAWTYGVEAGQIKITIQL